MTDPRATLGGDEPPPPTPPQAPGSAPPGPPGPPGPRGRRRFVPIALALVVLLVAGAVVFVVLDDGEAGAGEVTLEGVGTAGPDPFAAAVEVREVDDLDVAGAGLAVVEARVDEATGVRVVDGTAPDLFGGLPTERICDVEGLGAALDGSAAVEAWAAVTGAEADDVPGYLDGLTPVLLTADTWVTAHAQVGGGAEARQVVLQRGTAVLIDAQGAPAVKCANGNPLTAPVLDGTFTLADDVDGAWVGFDPGAVAGVEPGADEVEGFEVVDVTTGEGYWVPVGGTIEVAGLDLEPDGLGVVAFGASQSTAVATLTDLVGDPDLERARDYGGGCRSTTVWWGFDDPNGDVLVVEFETGGGAFVAYEARNVGPDPTPRITLRTPAGFAPGDPVDALAEAHPGATRRTTGAGVEQYVVDGYVLGRALDPGPDGAYVDVVEAGTNPCDT